MTMYSIVIQAGGKSTRMGKDKSFISLCGEPLIHIVIEKVAQLGNEIIITCNDPNKYSYLDTIIVEDDRKDYGPLAGLYSGIQISKNEMVIVVATDMPFINIGLLEYMKRRASPDVDVVIPRTTNGYEPLHAIYRRSTCLPAIEAAIDKHKRRIISWFDAVNVSTVEKETIDYFDPKGLAFFNINTLEDLYLAEQILTREVGNST